MSGPAHAALDPSIVTAFRVAGSSASIVGAVVGVLSDLGIFAGLGLGADAKIESELNQIINQLNTIHADLGTLTTDIGTSTQTIVNQVIESEIRTAEPTMAAAQARILSCVDTLTQAAAQPHSDANDAALLELAHEITSSTTNSACSHVQDDFTAIHTQIVTASVLGATAPGFYSLVASVAVPKKVPFANIVSHFVQYEVAQRQAVGLLRHAYTALGDPTTLQHKLTQSPNYLAELRDEEIAFLNATDVYISSQPVLPHDTSPAAVADALVQLFEETPRQATTYSLSILDNAQPLTPVLTPPASGASTVAMSNTLVGLTESYYGLSDFQFSANVADCNLATPGPGFAYLRPVAALHGGFLIGYGCTLHVERHMNAQLPTAVDSTWTVTGRGGSQPIGSPTFRNAATFATESSADGLALAADTSADRSPYSALSLVADSVDPTQVFLAVDLPTQAGARIGAGTTHTLVAGSPTPLAFTRVPEGARYPDEYAFRLAGGSYLALGSDGYATLAATPTYFDLRRTADGHVQIIAPDGRVLYVDQQYEQFFHGEAPDDVWGNDVNLALSTAAVAQWTYPVDGIPRTHASASPAPGELYYYPPCLDASGAGRYAGMTNYSGTQVSFDSTCSNGISNPFTFQGTSLTYVMYDAAITNNDATAHNFQLDVGGAAIGPAASMFSGTTYAGVHCYVPGASSPLDHLDAPAAATQPLQGSGTGIGGPWVLTVANNSTLIVRCMVLDHQSPPAVLVINEFRAKPCKGADPTACVTFQ